MLYQHAVVTGKQGIDLGHYFTIIKGKLSDTHMILSHTCTYMNQRTAFPSE